MWRINMQSRNHRDSSDLSRRKTRQLLATAESKHSLIAIPFCFVMPVHNESSTIATTISELNRQVMVYLPNSRLLTCEDGSTDGTAEVLTSLERRYPWLEVQTDPRRKGYARAVKDALANLDEERFEYVVFLDADGQYDPEDFFDLWNSAEKERPDIVVAGRRNRSEPYHRRVLSGGLRVLERVLFDPPCKDVTSAFRIMKTRVAKHLASEVKYSRYNFWLEFTARAAAEGYTVEEVPVYYRERDGSSRVYSVRRLPRIVLNELGALIRTWLEYKRLEVSRFLAVGVSGALLILGLTYLLTTMAGLYYPLSAAFAFEVSVIWAFFLNDKWTFKLKPQFNKLRHRLLRYNTLSLAGLIINEIVLIAMTELFHAYYLLSLTFAILITFAFNYFANSRWTWRSGRIHEPLAA